MAASVTMFCVHGWKEIRVLSGFPFECRETMTICTSSMQFAVNLSR